jgi:hypothetical protein
VRQSDGFLTASFDASLVNNAKMYFSSLWNFFTGKSSGLGVLTRC